MIRISLGVFYAVKSLKLVFADFLGKGKKLLRVVFAFTLSGRIGRLIPSSRVFESGFKVLLIFHFAQNFFGALDVRSVSVFSQPPNF